MPKKFDKEKCVSCSLCVALCPLEAFKLNNGTVEYLQSRCIDCENCIAAIGCPRRAINK